MPPQFGSCRSAAEAAHDLVLGQAVQLVDEPVDPPIRRVNLPLNGRLVQAFTKQGETTRPAPEIPTSFSRV